MLAPWLPWTLSSLSTSMRSWRLGSMRSSVLASRQWSMRTSVLTSMQPLVLASEQTATLGFVPAEARACALLLAVRMSELVTMLTSIRPSMPGGHSPRYRGGLRGCGQSWL